MNLISQDYLMHHGVKGMKWGVRRYQNADGSLTNKGKKKYIKAMYKDMRSHFNSQISPNARKVATIDRNGYQVQGMSWGEAYKKGKVTSKDYDQVRKAAASSRAYAKSKYGESAFKAMQQSGVLGRPIADFKIKQNPSTVLGKKYSSINSDVKRAQKSLNNEANTQRKLLKQMYDQGKISKQDYEDSILAWKGYK